MKTVLKYVMVLVPVIVGIMIYNLAKNRNWFGVGANLP